MGGPATFSGTTYQAHVTAVVYTHILSAAPLAWIGRLEIPTTVVPETGGVGDDLWIECEAVGLSFEAQVKHGLTSQGELRAMLARLAAAEAATLVLVVDSSASRAIRINLQRDLQRLMSGREDLLDEKTKQLASEVVGGFETLRRFRVVEVDADAPHHGARREAIANLRSCLEDPNQAEAAWAILVEDAAVACAQRLARTRPLLVAQLGERGIKVKLPGLNDRWNLRLDATKRLLAKYENEAVLAELVQLRKEMGAGPIEPRVRHRLAVHEAVALRGLGRFTESLRAAREAIDIEPKAAEGLANASYTALALGDTDTAAAFALRAREAEPLNAMAWSVSASVAHAQAVAPPNPPESIAANPDYRTTLANLALVGGSYDVAAEISTSLLSESVRTIPVLTIRAQARLALIADSTSEPLPTFQEIPAWTSEAIEQAPDRHPLLPAALAARAIARDRLGRNEDAAADVSRLQSIDSDDVNGIRQSARRLMIDGHRDQAYGVLLRPVVDQHADLLALRASVASELGRKDDARRDLEAAERKLGDAFDPEMARLQLAEVYLELEEVERAERLLEGLSVRAPGHGVFAVLWGRLHWKKGEVDKSVEQFQEAAKATPGLRVDTLGELASLALRADNYALAVEAFDWIGEEDIGPKRLPSFARALMETGNLVRVQQIIDGLSRLGPLPDWAVRVSVELASRREDPEAQAILLEELVRRDQATVQARLYLIRSLLELGRREEALAQLETASVLPGMDPLERMQVASFLSQLGQAARAVGVAFAAYRDAPTDPQITRSLVFITFMSGAIPRDVEEVGPSTYVKLENDSGDSEAHIVYAEGPIDVQRGERSIDDAKALGVWGKKVGDVVSRPGVGWSGTLTITEIIPAEMYVANDAAHNFGTRFPREPFFVRSIRFGHGNNVRDLAPMIAQLTQRRNQVEKALQVYKDQGFPLGMIAKMVGTSTPALMARGDGPPLDIPLFVEWRDEKGQAAVRAQLAATARLTISRSGLHTAAALGLLPILASAYGLDAPRSLLSELDAELLEADQHVERGQKSLSAGDTGLVVGDIQAGHPSLIRARDEISAQQTWLREHVTLHVRPLEVVAFEQEKDREVRDILGPAAYDAMRLAEHLEGALYTDDLGLRRMEQTPKGLRSCSTITLLGSLCERGFISPEVRDAHLVRLIEWRYETVLPTPELLVHALQRPADVSQSTLRRVLGTLANDSLGLIPAVTVLVEVVRRQSLGVVVVTVHETVVRALSLMSNVWPVQELVATLIRIAEERLRFLPSAHQECVRACRDFVQGRAIGAGGSG